MSSNQGTTSVNTFTDNKVIEFSNGQNSSIALSQDNSNVIIFGNDSNSLSNLNTDYSSPYDSVLMIIQVLQAIILQCKITCLI